MLSRQKSIVFKTMLHVLLLLCCCVVTNVVQLLTLQKEEEEKEVHNDHGMILQLQTGVDKSTSTTSTTTTTTTRKYTTRNKNVNKNKNKQHHPFTAEESERKKVVEVVVWPGLEDEDTYSSEFVNVYEDGIRQSPYLRLSFNQSQFFLPQLHNSSSNNNKNIYNIATVWLGLADADVVDVQYLKMMTMLMTMTMDYADTTSGDD